jgi:uncharacterized protein YjbI with pentapeptide repeats
LGVFVLLAFAVDRTLWDWLGLLIVPLVLAVGGYLFNSSQNQATQRAADRRAVADQQIAEQRRQDDALQAYLDNIGGLLLHEHHPLRQSKDGDEVRTLARARTLALLDSWLGGAGAEDRQRSVLEFLYESKLICKNRRVVDLRDANFIGAYLNDINLSAADLSGAWLSDTKMYRAKLSEANLSETALSGALLSADNNSDAADLSGADLSDAVITGEQLAKVKYLNGATMPNGQKYKDWLKSREEDGE